jgi:hypothetical protein
VFLFTVSNIFFCMNHVISLTFIPITRCCPLSKWFSASIRSQSQVAPSSRFFRWDWYFQSGKFINFGETFIFVIYKCSCAEWRIYNLHQTGEFAETVTWTPRLTIYLAKWMPPQSFRGLLLASIIDFILIHGK